MSLLTTTDDGRIIWEGIPESYWPHADKPWRVTWGFGCHEDFATQEEAQRFYERGKASATGGWETLWCEPFNAIEVDVDAE